MARLLAWKFIQTPFLRFWLTCRCGSCVVQKLLQLWRWDDSRFWYFVWWGWGEQEPVGEIHTVESYQMKSFRISLNEDATAHLWWGTLKSSEERYYDKHWIINQYIFIIVSLLIYLLQPWSDICHKLSGHLKRNINLCPEKAFIPSSNIYELFKLMYYITDRTLQLSFVFCFSNIKKISASQHLKLGSTLVVLPLLPVAYRA